jgi:transmembrane sensor
VLGLAAAWWQPWRTAAPAVAVAAGGRAVVLQPEKRGLPDGTVVELKSGAAIEVRYDDALRRVVLRGGAAHFAVAKDAARPFVVAAGGLEARAVGTAFLVDPTAGGVAVLVTEGRVAVSRAEAPAAIARRAEPVAQLTTVSAGEGVRLTPAAAAHAIEAVPATELSALLAWRVPRLEFADTPLDWVVTMFNTHGGARIVLDDESVGAGRVSGVLRADDPESLFRLLEVEFGLKAEQRDGVWHVRRG